MEGEAVLLSSNKDQSGVSIQSQDLLHQPMIIQGPPAHCQANVEKRIVNNITSWNYQYAKVDRFFLYFSPFLFLIFNTIYWGYFLLWDKLLCQQQ
jgi:hypothetical protein